MNLQLATLNQNVIGKKLGQKLFNSKGNLLLGIGNDISPASYSYIQEAGYRSVYVLTETSENGAKASEHLLSDKVRATAPAQLRNIYKLLLSKDKYDVSEGKTQLSRLTDRLVNEVNFRAEPPTLVDLKRQDDYLYQHAVHTAAYAILIGQSMQYNQMKLFEIATSALLCDFGMQYIEDEIVNKPGPLSEPEIEKVRSHTVLGFQHLGRHCSYKGLITIVALQHHERWDGSGYHQKIAGTDIHEYSRIVAAADFFDAYTSDRPHRRLHTIPEALAYLREHSNKEFEPRVVSHLLNFFRVPAPGLDEAGTVSGSSSEMERYE